MRLFFAAAIIFFVVAPLGAEENPDISSGIWKSTYPKFVRGSHYENLGSNFLIQNDLNNSVDLFFQTNWALNDAPKVLGVSLDKDFLTQRLAPEFGDFREIFNSLMGVFERIVIKDITLGAMIKLGTKIENVRIGVDIPVLYQITHFWATEKERAQIQEKLNDLYEQFPPGAFSEVFSKRDEDRLSELVTKQTEDFGLGDLRLYLEKTVMEKRGAKMLAGADLFISMRNHETTPIGALLARRKQVTSEILEKILDGNPSQADSNFKRTLFGIIENFFQTLRESHLRSQIDNFRTGVGVFVRPSVFLRNDSVEIFSKICANYLFSIERANVFPIQDMPTLETSGYTSRISPVSILHANFGVAVYPGKFYLGGGYDFFFKSSEKVQKISEPVYLDGTRILDKIQKFKSETSATTQHRVFASLGYRNMFSEKDFSAGLSTTGEWRYR